MGGSIIYQKFVMTGDSGTPRSTLQCCWREEKGEADA
uniref:S-adenosylmethionine decarboxylase proenzyme n=1 Tax=Rhizophora mucronata TaxID=61149 RepID=A0A2P2IWX6_RHIMU